MSDFDAPSYNQEMEDGTGFPVGAEEFRRLLVTDGPVIASLEYNSSMPGLLKNAIDWVSRYRPQPFDEMHALLLSASPSMVGGNRGLWALRIPLEQLGARVFPDIYSLSQAHKAFSDDGVIADPQRAERFEATITAFMNLVESAKHYLVAKKAWFEFLGEYPDLVTARAE